MMKTDQDVETFLDSPIHSGETWYSPQGSYRKELESFFADRDMEILFDQLPELNRYTKIVSPGILKCACVSGQRFVIKSVPPGEVEMQLNELKCGFQVFNAIDKFAPSPITLFGFDLSITIPEAIVATRTGRMMSVMLMHPFPTLDEVLMRIGDEEDRMLGHLRNVRRLYDFFSSHGIFWRDMAPRNILVDERHLCPRYVLLDFEKTRVSVNYTNDIEKEFWRGAVISEEFMSVCGEQAVAQVFSDKFDPSSWNTEEKGQMPSENMRREVECILNSHGERSPTVGEYNCLDRYLIKTRSPIRDGDGTIFFPGKMSFLVDHILGPAYDRKLNEVFLVAQIRGKMKKVCKTIHKTMSSAGASIKDIFLFSWEGNIHFDDEMFKECIDSLYAKYVREEGTIKQFMGVEKRSDTDWRKEG